MERYSIPDIMSFFNITGYLETFLNNSRTDLEKILAMPVGGGGNYSMTYEDIIAGLQIWANRNESNCNSSFIHFPYPDTSHGQQYCNSSWDKVTCWPTTAAGHMAEVSCPGSVEGIRYDSSQNATRMCYSNGTWQEKSNYTFCVPITPPPPDSIHNFIVRIIYFVGYTTSLVALVVALGIFIYFRSLRCLRNTIHCHLITTFIIRIVLWMTMNYQLLQFKEDESNVARGWVCKLTVTVYSYIQVTNFFWMLVEGLYLHTMIVWAFSVEKIRFWYYALLGWGVPTIIIFVWAVVKALFENESCWLPKDDTFYDFIYIVPILIVLLVNLIFLVSIVYLMITKLQASNTLQTRQYRKAVRATLILFPLLGVTYVVFITPPTNDALSRMIFVYFNAVLQSTQGLMVSVFYCFMNGEVRKAIKQKVERWQDNRSIASRYTRASIVTNTETIGLNVKRNSNTTTDNGRINSTSNITRSTHSSRDYTNGSSGFSGKDDNLNQVTTQMLKDEPL